MFSNSLDCVKSELEYQKRCLSSFKRRLSKLQKYDGYALVASEINGILRYYLSWREDGKERRSYLGADKASLIDELQEKYYLEKAISTCSNNIFELNSLFNSYVPLDSVCFTENMPRAYSDPNKMSRLLFKHQNKSAWKNHAEKVKAKYSAYKPQNLTHNAIDGTPTRSKSEALIYNMLLADNYTFVYELPTYIGNKLCLPDFTIYVPGNKSLVIIEHMGLMSSGIYCDDQTEKLQNYISNGWIPNTNLLLTFDDINGNIDTNSIHRMITTILS